MSGANADTVIVANSGGTDFSIVDVALGQQRRRHPLPSYEVRTVKTQNNAGDGLNTIITEYHFDDRPLFADRGLWEEPDPEVVRAMQQVYLDIEGDLEDDGASGA